LIKFDDLLCFKLCNSIKSSGDISVWSSWKGDILLSRTRWHSCQNCTNTPTRCQYIRRKTVELRDWWISGNRTGAIRLTSRLLVLSLAFTSRGRGTKFRTSSWHRGAPEGTPGTISSVRLVQLERNGRLMGLTCHALGSSNNSDFAGMNFLKGSPWITIDLLGLFPL